jgi:hypothetical protein
MLYRSNNVYPRKSTSSGDEQTSEKGTVYGINTSSLRSYLYAGEITVDDVNSLDPFNNLFSVIR